MEEPDIKVSVVIPVYNRGHTIERCLDSVLNQTYPVAEVILVNDCSNDNFLEVLKKFEGERIRVIHHDRNKGAQAARNTGIRAASYEWIAFQDADDEWCLNKIKLQTQIIARNHNDPYLFIHGNLIINDGITRSIGTSRIEGIKPLQDMLAKPSPYFPAILTSKIALMEIGLLDERVKSHQEWHTSIQLARICTFIHIQEVLFVWNRTYTDSISSNQLNHILGYEYIIRKFEREIKSIDYGRAYFWHEVTLVIKALKRGLFIEAKRLLSCFENKDSREYLWLKLYSIFKLPLTNESYADSSTIVRALIEIIYRIRLNLK